jgi:hypothetical protein
MALTKRQFADLRRRGLSVDEIINLERGVTPSVDLTFERDTKQPFGGRGAERVRQFATAVFGGGKLAEGIGGALVSKEVRETLDEETKQTLELQEKIQERIVKARKEGKDTSRLEAALTNAQNLTGTLTGGQVAFAEALPTTREVIGSTARLGATLAGGAMAQQANKMVALGKATNFFGGALRGAASGAGVGAIQGAIHGGGIAAERDATGREIATSAGLGAAGGAVLGGAIGAVGGGLTGVSQGRARAREEFTRRLVAPKETTKVRAEAITKGEFEDPTLFKKAQLSITQHDEQMAAAVDDVVQPKASLRENVDAIRLKINRVGAGVEDYVTKNKAPFNEAQLRAKLNAAKGDSRLIFAGDKTSERIYDAVIDEFVENVGKKDTLGLFKARQTFDRIPAVKKLLQSEGLGENVRRQVVLDVRRAANNYVADLLPQGNVFKEVLFDEHLMFEALGNIGESNATIIGKNGLQLLMNEYPAIKWLIGGAAAGGAYSLGARLSGGVGAGSTIIGSTD